ncbi:MAG TPA: glutathione S-transferase N-terminal domain-containing protein [Candidatus Paceibacterota bacterium]
MITLYVKDGCPYCAAVLHKIDEIALVVNLKNIKDESVIEELIEKGGKQQVPYMVDEDKNVSMYESADIVEYLDREYKKADDTI